MPRVLRKNYAMVARRTVRKAKRRVIRGKGSYYSDYIKPAAKYVVSRGLRYAGQYLGNKYGGSRGGQIGRNMGARFSKILGAGSYSAQVGISKPKGGSLAKSLEYDVNGELPAMHSYNQSIRFRYREYIGDLNTSTGFSLTSFNLNPGLNSTFPYLSQLAVNFQEYRFHGLCFYLNQQL